MLLSQKRSPPEVGRLRFLSARGAFFPVGAAALFFVIPRSPRSATHDVFFLEKTKLLAWLDLSGRAERFWILSMGTPPADGVSRLPLGRKTPPPPCLRRRAPAPKGWMSPCKETD